MVTFKAGHILTVTWYDRFGSHAAGAVVDDCTPPHTVKSKIKGKDKKTRIVEQEVEGTIIVTVYQPGEPVFGIKAAITTNGDEVKWDAGTHYQGLQLSEPTARDLAVIKKRIAYEETVEQAKPERKGNPEALQRAAEVRRSVISKNDGDKLKLLKKQNPYAEGSNRAKIFDALKASATVGEFCKKCPFSAPRGHLKRMQGEGLVEVGGVK